MNKTTCLVISLTCFLSLSAMAADKKIICEPPEGTRLDYFMSNRMNIENKKFHMGRDRVSKFRPVIILHDDNPQVVTFYFDNEQGNAKYETKNMKVIERNLQLITFTGLFNDAPIMASYYPLFDALIYSQQSLWPGANYSGARAVLFYAKCEDVN